MVDKAKLSLDDARALAAQDLAARLGHSEFTTSQARSVTWRDTSLGCPEPGQMYGQVLVPGYLIEFNANGRSYRFHSGTKGVPVMCPEGRAREPLADPPDA